MKRITQNLVWVSVFAVACSKSPVTQPGGGSNPPVTIPAPAGALSKIEIDGESLDLFYNANGSINNMVRKDNGGTILSTYVFSYENDKLKEINFGGKWKYTYTGNNLTKIESYNAGGQLRYTYEFVYDGNKVVEKTDYLTVVYKMPQFKRTFTYRSDGNIDRVKVYQYTNGVWGESEEIQYNEYDQHANATDQYESYPYLPANLFSPNNATKETWYSGGIVGQSVTHQYSYDANGRVKTKKSTFSYAGFPDTFVEMKLTYQ